MPHELEERVESADYTVIVPTALVYSKPHSGVVVGEKCHGTVVSSSICTSGATANDAWVRLNEAISTSESGEGWMLVDGRMLGLGIQLERRVFERPRPLKWYLAVSEVEIRDAMKGGVVVGHRAAGRILRTDFELCGWCRLTEDFRRERDGGDPDIVEGWFSLAANDVSSPCVRRYACLVRARSRKCVCAAPAWRVSSLPGEPTQPCQLLRLGMCACGRLRDGFLRAAHRRHPSCSRQSRFECGWRRVAA